METVSVNVAVQSGFTEYVPLIVIWNMLPFWLTQAVPLMAPLPSKDCRPTPANGPAWAGGAVRNPVLVYANVPFRLALEQTLSAACADGEVARASAATAIANVFPMVLSFMLISFAGSVGGSSFATA